MLFGCISIPFEQHVEKASTLFALLFRTTAQPAVFRKDLILVLYSSLNTPALLLYAQEALGLVRVWKAKRVTVAKKVF